MTRSPSAKPPSEPPSESPSPKPPAGKRASWWANWILAVLTVPMAAGIVVYAMGAALSYAGCSAGQCPSLGPGGLVYGLLIYGAPVVALVTIVFSTFTAKLRDGYVVPLVAWGLLIVDMIVMAVLLGD